MATKLFDTVNYYDAGVAFNAAPAEMLLIDLAIIAADVTVTFPAGTIAGQCIGVQCVGADGVSSIAGAGPVSTYGMPLRRAGECALYTWDPDFPGAGTWVLVSDAAAPGNNAVVFERSFTDADLSGGALQFQYLTILGGPAFAVYDDGDQLVQPTLAVITPYTVVLLSDSEALITFDAALLPLVGTWFVTVIGPRA